MGKVELSNLHKRILSALVLAPLTLGVVYLGGPVYIALILAAAALVLREWMHLARLGGSYKRDCIIGAVYVFLSAAAFIDLRLRHHDSGLGLVVTLMLCVWGSDIGAYIFGRTIGGPKLCPAVSPNKTWAGLAGAMLFPGVILSGIVHFSGYNATDAALGLAAGLVFGVVGQAGDLMISKFKRRAGVKDTGTLIPGHGGLLDRVDSVMLLAPVFFLAYVLWL